MTQKLLQKQMEEFISEFEREQMTSDLEKMREDHTKRLVNLELERDLNDFLSLLN